MPFSMKQMSRHRHEIIFLNLQAEYKTFEVNHRTYFFKKKFIFYAQPRWTYAGFNVTYMHLSALICTDANPVQNRRKRCNHRNAMKIKNPKHIASGLSLWCG